MPALSPVSGVAAFNRLPVWRQRMSVWNFRVTPPTLDRALYLWLHRMGAMGADERAFFTRAIAPGMHVVDVGANVGLYSLLFARLVGPQGRVYAFEPDELMEWALRRNLAENGMWHAEVFACAVGGSAGRAVLRRHAVNSGDNRLVGGEGPEASGHPAVAVRTLEEALSGRRVDFVKIDVQGWEAQALNGLGSLLDVNPGLQIYFEFWPYGLEGAETSVATFARMIRSQGLRVWRPEAGTQSSPVDIEELSRTMRRKAYVNLLASR